MNEKLRQELSGKLFAHELLLNLLLKRYIDQLPDNEGGTEYLGKLLSDMQDALALNQQSMAQDAFSSAQSTLLRLFDASCQRYWT